MKQHLIAAVVTLLVLAWMASIPMTHGVTFVLTLAAAVVGLIYFLALEVVRSI